MVRNESPHNGYVGASIHDLNNGYIEAFITGTMAKNESPHNGYVGASITLITATKKPPKLADTMAL
jgi:hypothetical protein